MKSFLLRKKINKKASHVGIVLSFALFVMALIFMVTIFSDFYKKDNSKMDEVDYLSLNLINLISEEMIVVNLNLGTEHCYKIITPPEINSSYKPLFVKYGEEEFPSAFYYEHTILQGTSGFSKIYYYKQGLIKNETFLDHTCKNLEIKSVEKQKIICMEKIISNINFLSTDYPYVKTQLKSNFDTDLNIRFIDASGKVYGKTVDNLKTEIFAKEKTIKYLTKSGKEEMGRIILEIW